MIFINAYFIWVWVLLMLFALEMIHTTRFSSLTNLCCTYSGQFRFISSFLLRCNLAKFSKVFGSQLVRSTQKCNGAHIQFKFNVYYKIYSEMLVSPYIHIYIQYPSTQACSQTVVKTAYHKCFRLSFYLLNLILYAKLAEMLIQMGKSNLFNYFNGIVELAMNYEFIRWLLDEWTNEIRMNESQFVNHKYDVNRHNMTQRLRFYRSELVRMELLHTPTIDNNSCNDYNNNNISNTNKTEYKLKLNRKPV